MFNPTNLFFVFSVFQASYLTKPAFQAPNPDPSHATKADPMVNPTVRQSHKVWQAELIEVVSRFCDPVRQRDGTFWCGPLLIRSVLIHSRRFPFSLDEL